MTWRPLLIASVLLAGASVGAVSASKDAPRQDATCSLPGMVSCLTDPPCTPYGAVCDVPSGLCVCPSADLGMDLGPGGDLAGADLALGSDGGGGAGGSSGGGATSPVGGGGMTGPLKTGGCSFVPGTR